MERHQSTAFSAFLAISLGLHAIVILAWQMQPISLTPAMSTLLPINLSPAPAAVEPSSSDSHDLPEPHTEARSEAQSELAAKPVSERLVPPAPAQTPVSRTVPQRKARHHDDNKRPPQQASLETESEPPLAEVKSTTEDTAITTTASQAPETVNTAQAATAPQTMASTPSPTAQDRQRIGQRIRQQLDLRIALHHYYPAVAVRNTWQGRVNLGVRVEANGRLSRVQVLKSSGYAVLDNAAVASINRVENLPEATLWLDGRHIDVVLPVIYRLKES